MSEIENDAKTSAGTLGSVLPVGGRVFYSSDWHLMHARIRELCGRPFASVEEMSWTIIENCNQMVTERDTLVLMGDTALGKLEGGGGTLAMLGEIRAGRLVLLPGNHDRWSLAYGHRGDAAARRLTRARWRAVYRSAASSGKWGAKRGADGVLVVPDRTPSMWQAWIGGQMVNLSHYPYRGGGDSRGGGVDRYESLRGEDPGAESGVPLICGHVHTAWRDSVGERGGRMINVGVDQWGFAPVPESALAEMAWAA